MIPTYNTPPDYLEQTLRSVLAQDPGAERMQIEVIDDCSPNGPPLDLVRSLAGERVCFHQEPVNLGLARIWNRCIERARGQWVHILHQDDLVLPGFYERLGLGTDSPAAPGLVYSRYAYIDEDGHWTGLSPIEAKRAGPMDHALQRLVREQVLQTPAIAVKRSVYAAVGGFRSDLCYSLDWEMWCRIARQYPIWFEPKILACYRIHSANKTSQLMLRGQDVDDARKCINIISHYLPDAVPAAQARRYALRLAALGAVENARRFLHKKMFVAALRQLKGALKCGAPFTVLYRVLALCVKGALRSTVKTLRHAARSRQ